MAYDFLVINDIRIVGRFVSQERLAEALGPDVIALQQGHVPSATSAFVGCWYGQELRGIIRVDEFSNEIARVHPYLSPQYWGTGVGSEIFEEFCDYIQTAAGIKQLMISTPLDCKVVLAAAERNKFKQFGVIPKGCEWTNGPTDLVMFIRDLGE